MRSIEDRFRAVRIEADKDLMPINPYWVLKNLVEEALMEHQHINSGLPQRINHMKADLDVLSIKIDELRTQLDLLVYLANV